MKIIGLSAAALLLAVAGSSAAPQAAPSGFASGADVDRQVAAMLAEMKPDQGFMWRPLVRDGNNVAAIEIWKKPGRPAVHPADSEYAIVLEGQGTMIWGGKLINPDPKRSTLIDGDSIEGGETRTLAKGDVILIPAGVPHGFGITGDRLVLLGIKLPGSK